MSRNGINLRAVVPRIHAAADVALEAAAAHVLAVSNRVIPEESGELKRSGDSGLTGRHRAAVTYSDPSAIPAHERLDVPPANGRQRKYLETAFTSERANVLAMMAREVRRVLD